MRHFVPGNLINKEAFWGYWYNETSKGKAHKEINVGLMETNSAVQCRLYAEETFQASPFSFTSVSAWAPCCFLSLLST